MASGGSDVVRLVEGEAAYMGDGMFLVTQMCDKVAESVLLQKADLEALLAICTALGA
jgi:hypothetical protein